MISNAGKYVTGLIVACLCLITGAAAQAADLIGVRFGPNGDATRIVFDLSGDAAYSVSGDGTGNGRLVVTFANLSISAPDHNFRPGKGHIARFGFAAGEGAKSRAVFEFKKTAKIKDVFMIPPQGAVKKYRLVVDLVTAGKPEFLASLPSQYPDLAAVIQQATAEPPPPTVVVPPSPTQKQAALPPKPAQLRQIIVIDAGHGGGDPGSQGQSGTMEKSVTLAAALELAKILKKRGGYDVVLTRESNADARIKSNQRAELARREALAREAHADLFISLHADAISQPAVRGASVYTLSEKGSARSAKVTKSQGDYLVYDLDLEKYDQIVGDILLDKAQDKTSTASSKLAEVLIDNLSPRTPMLNRSHRTADLRVLLAPDVPAVLLEMAFISNAKDEANLKSPVWRKRSMTAVANAIDQYFEEYADQRFASNRPGGAR
jgi:N-acetylmuramoyl-L-alanine amidase